MKLTTLKDFLKFGLNKADNQDKKNYGKETKYIGNDLSDFSGTDFKSKYEAKKMWQQTKKDNKK